MVAKQWQSYEVMMRAGISINLLLVCIHHKNFNCFAPSNQPELNMDGKIT